MYQPITAYDPKQLNRDVRAVALTVAGFLLAITIVSLLVMLLVASVELLRDPSVQAALRSSNPLETLSSLLDTNQMQRRIYTILVESSGLASVVGMLVAAPLCFCMRGKRLITSDLVRVNARASYATLAIMALFILGIQCLMTGIQLVAEVLLQQGDGLTSNLDSATTGIASSPWGLVYLLLVGPFCEELLFRGAVLRKLEPYGANFAIFMSSLLFGLYHMILFQSVFAFLIGLVLAYTAGRFSLKWSFALHVFNNSLAAMSLLLHSLAFNVFLLSLYVIGLITIVVVLISRFDLFSAQKRAGAPSQPAVYLRAFRSPWLTALVLILLTFTVLNLGIF